jgi:hypothetical protein
MKLIAYIVASKQVKISVNTKENTLHGSVQEVIEDVRSTLKVMMPGGVIVVRLRIHYRPIHRLKILAMYHAVKEFGSY